MVIHLDASFLIALANVQSVERDKISRWMREHRPIATSSIAWAEFLCGPLQPGAAALVWRVVGDPIPFCVDDAARAAELFNITGRRRGSLNDCMIAAIALRADAAVATSDAAHFSRFASLGVRLAQ